LALCGAARQEPIAQFQPLRALPLRRRLFRSLGRLEGPAARTPRAPLDGEPPPPPPPWRLAEPPDTELAAPPPRSGGRKSLRSGLRPAAAAAGAAAAGAGFFDLAVCPGTPDGSGRCNRIAVTALVAAHGSDLDATIEFVEAMERAANGLEAEGDAFSGDGPRA
jgi:hypothetical protein